MKAGPALMTVFLSVLSSGAFCEQAADLPTVRSPGDMTVDERVTMMNSANDYNTCVYTEALERLDADPDIRRIADLAMGYCQPQLEDLRASIQTWGFDGHFAEGFTRNVRDRAARKLLPELAIRKSR